MVVTNLQILPSAGYFTFRPRTLTSYTSLAAEQQQQVLACCQQKLFFDSWKSFWHFAMLLFRKTRPNFSDVAYNGDAADCVLSCLHEVGRGYRKTGPKIIYLVSLTHFHQSLIQCNLC